MRGWGLYRQIHEKNIIYLDLCKMFELHFKNTIFVQCSHFPVGDSFSCTIASRLHADQPLLRVHPPRHSCSRLVSGAAATPCGQRVTKIRTGELSSDTAEAKHEQPQSPFPLSTLHFHRPPTPTLNKHTCFGSFIITLRNTCFSFLPLRSAPHALCGSLWSLLFHKCPFLSNFVQSAARPHKKSMARNHRRISLWSGRLMCDKLCLEGVKPKAGRREGTDQRDQAMWGREHSFQMAWQNWCWSGPSAGVVFTGTVTGKWFWHECWCHDFPIILWECWQCWS